MPNDAPNANGSNDSSKQDSESVSEIDSGVSASLDSFQMHISAAAPDGEANEVFIFSKKIQATRVQMTLLQTRILKERGGTRGLR